MRSQPAMSYVFPKPGPALWAILVATAALGILAAFLATWVPAGEQLFLVLTCELDHAFTQPWRLVSSGLLTSPAHLSHLLFSLAGLYFLGAPLEQRWGPWRFARLFAIAVLLGNLVTLAADKLVPLDAQARFHPQLVFGPTAAITAIAIAWSREFRDSTVNLFFVVPIRATTLLWVTIGFCVLDLVYPAGLPEGVLAPFGGVLAGLLLGGSPSLARAAWLRLRLALLRRRTGLRVDDILSPKHKARPRSGTPPLRVIRSGTKPPTPNDKRYLN